jgi:hypothetical protein
MKASGLVRSERSYTDAFGNEQVSWFSGEPVLLYAGSGVFDLALDNTCIIVYNYTR